MSELRRGYKQTEVGVIPEDWKLQSLEQIADPKRPIGYGIVQTGRPVNNGVRCLRVVDILGGTVDTANLITTSPEISNAYRRTILAKGHLRS
jgi:type I restriction enzyme S subunit